MSIVIFVLLVLSSCNVGNTIPTVNTNYKQDINGWGTIVQIRGCDYIKSAVHGGYVYTHCGDCPNSIHYNQND